MTKTTITEKLIQVTRFVLKDNDCQGIVTTDKPLDESGIGLGSLGQLSLILAIEKEFNCTFPEECWNHNYFRSLDDIATCIQNIQLKESSDEN